MKTLLLFSSVIFSFLFTASAAADANSLEPNNVSQWLKTNGFEWFLGTWDTVTDSNVPASASFELILDGQALSVKANIGQTYHFAGLVYYDHTKKIIVNTGVDNGGRIFGGSWEAKQNKILINLEETNPDGTINNCARYLSQVNPDTMLSVTYSVFEGHPSRKPINVLEFKRRK